MKSVEELRAELAVAELTEKLIAAKAAGDVETKKAVAAELRAAREQHRTAYPPAPAGPGDAVAAPAPIVAGFTQKG
jgi:hypothetical protein